MKSAVFILRLPESALAALTKKDGQPTEKKEGRKRGKKKSVTFEPGTEEELVANVVHTLALEACTLQALLAKDYFVNHPVTPDRPAIMTFLAARPKLWTLSSIDKRYHLTKEGFLEHVDLGWEKWSSEDVDEVRRRAHQVCGTAFVGRRRSRFINKFGQSDDESVSSMDDLRPRAASFLTGSKNLSAVSYEGIEVPLAEARGLVLNLAGARHRFQVTAPKTPSVIHTASGVLPVAGVVPQTQSFVAPSQVATTTGGTSSSASADHIRRAMALTRDVTMLPKAVKRRLREAAQAGKKARTQASPPPTPAAPPESFDPSKAMSYKMADLRALLKKRGISGMVRNKQQAIQLLTEGSPPSETSPSATPPPPAPSSTPSSAPPTLPTLPTLPEIPEWIVQGAALPQSADGKYKFRTFTMPHYAEAAETYHYIRTKHYGPAQKALGDFAEACCTALETMKTVPSHTPAIEAWYEREVTKAARLHLRVSLLRSYLEEMSRFLTCSARAYVCGVNS
eukprot:Sspe_Gene.69153::Locus_40759_Transcript_1_1_Confidence_1.000_Length_1602::g.69153::m.69153